MEYFLASLKHPGVLGGRRDNDLRLKVLASISRLNEKGEKSRLSHIVRELSLYGQRPASSSVDKACQNLIRDDYVMETHMGYLVTPKAIEFLYIQDRLRRGSLQMGFKQAGKERALDLIREKPHREATWMTKLIAEWRSARRTHVGWDEAASAFLGVGDPKRWLADPFTGCDDIALAGAKAALVLYNEEDLKWLEGLLKNGEL